MAAYLFLWNPKKDPQSFRDYERVCADAKAGRPYETRWLCRSKQPQAGDTAYVQRTGDTNSGVFAKGVVTRGRFKYLDTHFVRLRLDMFLPLGSEVPKTETVAVSGYKRNWMPMASGNVIPEPLLRAIQTLWSRRATPPDDAHDLTVADVRPQGIGRPNIQSSLRSGSPGDVARVLERLYPSEPERHAVLARLLNSVAVADAVAPSAWAATFFPWGFRLNVGQVEVYVAGEHDFFLNCAAAKGMPPFDTDAFTDANYRSVPGSQCHYRGVPADLLNLPAGVERAHAKFIELAAHSPSGKLRSSTPFKRFHSEALLAYARRIVGGVGGASGNRDQARSGSRPAESTGPLVARQNLFPDDLETGKKYFEGAMKRILVNAYERDPKARTACLKHHGRDCVVCGFNFDARYGELGKDFIHVHHLKPLALTDGEYELDPVADLRPVCPNCHAMLHRGESVLSIEELRRRVERLTNVRSR